MDARETDNQDSGLRMLKCWVEGRKDHSYKESYGIKWGLPILSSKHE